MKPALVCMAAVLLVAGSAAQLLQLGLLKSISDIFIGANITLDVFGEAPQSTLQLSFGDFELSLGSEISPDCAVGPLKIGFDFEIGAHYTLIMLGPDEPSRDSPFLSLYIMGLYVNIYGCADGVAIEESCEIVTYIPPNPPPGTGLHRFVIYILKQTGIIDTSDPELLGLQIRRAAFALNDFVANHELTGPIAGTFFYTKYPTCSTLL